MYIIVCTMLDISHAVNVISRYKDLPKKIHWQIVKWIFWYSRGTSYVGLVYIKSSDVSRVIIGYVDS